MWNFRNFEIWKEEITLVKQIYILAAELPKEEKFGLRSQITSAAISVPLNIAEGSSRMRLNLTDFYKLP